MFCRQQAIELPPQGVYATGLIFLEKDTYRKAKESVRELAEGCGLSVICWRSPAVNSAVLGVEARKNEPLIRQVTPKFIQHHHISSFLIFMPIEGFRKRQWRRR